MVTPQVVNVHLDFGCSASSAPSSSGTNAPAADKLPTAPPRKVIKRIISGTTRWNQDMTSSASAKRDRDEAAGNEKPTLHATPSRSSDSAPSRGVIRRIVTGGGTYEDTNITGKRPRSGETSRSFLEAAKPLPELVRPRTLDDFVGQEHLLGEGALLRGLIDADRIGSAIFWGPPVRFQPSSLLAGRRFLTRDCLAGNRQDDYRSRHRQDDLERLQRTQRDQRDNRSAARGLHRSRECPQVDGSQDAVVHRRNPEVLQIATGRFPTRRGGRHALLDRLNNGEPFVPSEQRVAFAMPRLRPQQADGRRHLSDPCSRAPDSA